MVEWWEALSLLEKIMACIACPATVVLVVQTILLIFGAGDAQGDMSVDVDGDGIPDAGNDMDGVDTGVRIFTVRGLITFFSIFGWGALVISRSGAGPAVSIIGGVILGSCAMVLTGYALYWSMKLQSDGTVHYKNALGLTGRVYLPVPPGRSGTGKVNVLIQERFCECDAVTDEESTLETNCEVVVTGTSGQNTLTVRRKMPL